MDRERAKKVYKLLEEIEKLDALIEQTISMDNMNTEVLTMNRFKQQPMVIKTDSEAAHQVFKALEKHYREKREGLLEQLSRL